MLRTLSIMDMAKALRQALNDRKIDLVSQRLFGIDCKQFGVKD